MRKLPSTSSRTIRVLSVAIACALSLTAMAHTSTGSATESADVLQTAKKVNAYFVSIWPDPTKATFVRNKKRPSSLWTRGVYYEGLMALQAVAPDDAYLKYTDDWANFHMWTPRNGTKTVDADDQCCCQTYLDRWEQTGKKNAYMFDSTKVNLEKEMATGRVDYWTWIDALQMAVPLYSKMYRLTGDAKYILYAKKGYEWTRNKCGGGLWNSKEGLWWRDKDFVPPYKESDGANCYWSRGDGWVVLCYCKTIDDIEAALQVSKGSFSRKLSESEQSSSAKVSEGDKKQVVAFLKELKADYLAMMKALLKLQREDGFWNVSLASPATFGGPEASGTALFLYGMSWGIMHKMLPAATYRPACDKAWKALSTQSIHDNGFPGYIQGTGKEPKDGQPVTYNSIPDFEDYGTGCVLLGLTEYYKLIKK